MVHHRGRPDLFKYGTKYSEADLKVIIADESRPIFVDADEAGRAAGYAFCILKQAVDDPILTDIRTLYIDDLCVDEALRGRQIGRGLLEHVKAYARDIGCYNLTLNVWCMDGSALGFYEKCGLKPQKVGMEVVV
ncbi:MAG: GNAT family N-acetyltransferase [Clostridia bacterium]|nr:GNAT family N-acetyltransferase [Clostridia bacterium]